LGDSCPRCLLLDGVAGCFNPLRGGRGFLLRHDQSATMLAQRRSRRLAVVTRGTNLLARMARNSCGASSGRRLNSPAAPPASRPNASRLKTRCRNSAKPTPQRSKIISRPSSLHRGHGLGRDSHGTIRLKKLRSCSRSTRSRAKSQSGNVYSDAAILASGSSLSSTG